MLVKSSMFSEIGMMDERYFAYSDDVDFVFRARRNGVSILYYPKATVYHNVGQSTGGAESLFSVYYSNRNRVYFIRKHYCGIKKIVALTVFLCTRVLKSILFTMAQRKKLVEALRDGFQIRLVDEIK